MKLLLRTISELKTFVGSTAGSKFEDYAHDLRRATETHLIPLVGLRFYDQLLSLYEASENDDAVYQAQAAVASFAAKIATPRLAVMINSKGITRKEGQGEKSAYQYQVRDLQASYQQAGWEALERLLEHLEENQKEKKYSQFHRSKYASYDDDLFISNTAQMQQYVDIHGQRQLFVQLLPHLREAQLRLARELGQAFYDQLHRQHKAQKFARKHEGLVPLMRKAIANLAYAEYMDTRVSTLTPEGFRQPVGSTNDDIAAQMADKDNRVGSLIRYYRSNAEAYITDLHRILRETPKQFPLYVVPENTSLTHEADDKTFFMF